MRARLSGLLIAVGGVAAAPAIFRWIYDNSPESMSDARAAIWSLIVITGCLAAFAVGPASAIVGSSIKVTARERSIGEGLFVLSCLSSFALQILAEMVRGPWYGLPVFMLKASLANGLWFGAGAAAMKVRQARLTTANN